MSQSEMVQFTDQNEFILKKNTIIEKRHIEIYEQDTLNFIFLTPNQCQIINLKF